MFSNFIFNKISSETYGIMCVRFGTTSGEEMTSGGSETELKTSKTPRSNEFHILSQEYTKPLSFTFQIINKDASDISSNQERMLNKWLCKTGKYFDLQIDDELFSDIQFEANISNPQLIKVGKLVGMEFTVNCKHPFGNSPLITKTYTTTTANQQIRVLINNDEDDFIRPNVKITANTAGTLNITNDTEVANRVFTVTNLTQGEIVTVDGKIPDISSSTRSKSVIFANFNKRWMRFVDGLNILTISTPSTITITYKETRKVGI